jgi:hypothetical protein
MELIKEFDTDISNKIKLNNIQYNSHYFKHRDYNTNYYSQNKFISYDDTEIYSPKLLSSENIRMIRTMITMNTINTINTINNNKIDDIGLELNKLTIGCNYIFHDDRWLKFYKDNFICSIDDDIKYIYCNSFNREDMNDPNLIQFIKILRELNFEVKFINFDETEEDLEEEYENNSVTWFVILVKK